MCIPHGNADTERMFSHLNAIKSSSRTRLSDATLKASLVVKLNNNIDCYKFEPSHQMILDARQVWILLYQLYSNFMPYSSCCFITSYAMHMLVLFCINRSATSKLCQLPTREDVCRARFGLWSGGRDLNSKTKAATKEPSKIVGLHLCITILGLLIKFLNRCLNWTIDNQLNQTSAVNTITSLPTALSSGLLWFEMSTEKG